MRFSPSKTRLFFYRFLLVVLSPLLFFGALEMVVRVATTGRLSIF